MQLAAVARQVSTEKDYSVRAKTGAGGETGLLISSFNEMLSQIESSNSQLRQHREQLEEQVAFRTSELVAASGQLKLQSEALNAASNAIIITDLEGKIVWCNPAFSALSGYRLDEVLGKNPSLLRSGRQDREFYKQMWATITAGAIGMEKSSIAAKMEPSISKT